MSIVRRDYYKRGSWNAISDLDGQKRKASDMRMQWNGLWVGKEEWSPKHPQQEPRPRLDRPARSPVRSTEPRITDLTESYYSTEVLSSSDVEYTVSSRVLSSGGVSYVVDPEVLTSAGAGLPIFNYSRAYLGGHYPNLIFLPPPVTPAEMI